MANRMTSIRLAPGTDAKLAALAARYGTAATAVAVAVDRLYQTEIGAPQVAKATGAFDFVLMESEYRRRAEAAGHEQARRELLAALTEHAARIMVDAAPDAVREQVRLAANGLFARTGQPVLQDGEL